MLVGASVVGAEVGASVGSSVLVVVDVGAMLVGTRVVGLLLVGEEEVGASLVGAAVVVGAADVGDTVLTVHWLHATRQACLARIPSSLKRASHRVSGLPAT